MRITTAREQVEMLSPWTLTAAPRRTRFEQIPSKGLDALGITQRKLNGNFNSWMDTLSDQDKEEGGLWYPTGNDWVNTRPQNTIAIPTRSSGPCRSSPLSASGTTTLTTLTTSQPITGTTREESSSPQASVAETT